MGCHSLGYSVALSGRAGRVRRQRRRVAIDRVQQVLELYWLNQVRSEAVVRGLPEIIEHGSPSVLGLEFVFIDENDAISP